MSFSTFSGSSVLCILVSMFSLSKLSFVSSLLDFLRVSFNILYFSISLSFYYHLVFSSFQLFHFSFILFMQFPLCLFSTLSSVILNCLFFSFPFRYFFISLCISFIFLSSFHNAFSFAFSPRLSFGSVFLQFFIIFLFF